MLRHTRLMTAAFALTTFFFATIDRGKAMVFGTNSTARIDFASTTATPPFDFVTFTLSFSDANRFGSNETLSYSTFNASNQMLTSGTFASGNSSYSSGVGGALTINAIVPFNSGTQLTTTAYYALITPTVGSFDLIGATANFQHILSNNNLSGQNGVQGAITSAAAVPAPIVGAGLPGLLMAFGGLLAWRRRRSVIA